MTLVDVLQDVDIHLTRLTSLGLVAAFIALLIGISYIQTFFSCRLRGLPGPSWTKFSDLDMLIAVIAGRRVHRLYDLHNQYGPIVRVGPNEISISDWKLYRGLYNNPTLVKEVNFYSPFILGHGSLFQMTNPDQHAARRKASNPAYSLRNIAALNPFIRQLADEMVANMIHEAETSPTSETSAFDHSAMYSFKAICKLSFNADFSGPAETAKAQAILDAMNGCIMAFLVDKLWPALRSSGIANRLPGPIGTGCRAHDFWADKTRDMVDGLLRQETKGTNDTQGRFFLSPVAHSVDEFQGRRLGETELLAEAMGVMVGGAGTLSTTLTYLLYELSRPENRHVQTRLRREVRAIPDEDIAALRNNAYVKAVVTETLRLYPSIVSTLPRVSPNGSLHLGDEKGAVVEAGTVVGMQHFVHQRDAGVFEDANKWVPERWLEPTEEMNGALTVFSVGKRACIGLNLAWEELFLAINAFMRADVELSLGKDMKESEMVIEDRFAAVPRGKRLVLRLVKL